MGIGLLAAGYLHVVQYVRPGGSWLNIAPECVPFNGRRQVPANGDSRVSCVADTFAGADRGAPVLADEESMNADDG